ncbi:MAG: hypothetical protein ABEK50_18845 [bacterium]
MSPDDHTDVSEYACEGILTVSRDIKLDNSPGELNTQMVGELFPEVLLRVKRNWLKERPSKYRHLQECDQFGMLLKKLEWELDNHTLRLRYPENLCIDHREVCNGWVSDIADSIVRCLIEQYE